MTEKVEIENTESPAEVKGAEAALPKEDKNIATWQFRYSNYRAILPYIDENAETTLSGKRQRAVIKARNYRIDLDLRKPEQKKKHDALMKDQRRGLDFWLLSNAKRKQKATEQGSNLQKLLHMPEPQLRGILSGDELMAVGLNPATVTRYEIAMAVITGYNKTLVLEPEKEKTE